MSTVPPPSPPLPRRCPLCATPPHTLASVCAWRTPTWPGPLGKKTPHASWAGKTCRLALLRHAHYQVHRHHRIAANFDVCGALTTHPRSISRLVRSKPSAGHSSLSHTLHDEERCEGRISTHARWPSPCDVSSGVKRREGWRSTCQRAFWRCPVSGPKGSA
jgi:hypothetical protein